MREISTFIEYGAFGILALTLVGAYLMFVRVLALIKETTQVVTESTVVIRNLKDQVKSSYEVCMELKELLRKRPCLKDDC